MTQKNINKFDELKKKIHWFLIPLMVTFFTWITVMMYTSNASIQVVQTQLENREKSENIIWQLVKDNNEILKTKSDAKSNESEHQLILSKVKDIDVKVDKIYRNRSSFGSVDIDTNYKIPYKSDSFIWVKNNDLTDADRKEIR